MLRGKISIVLAPRVLDDLDSIGKSNGIKPTEIMTKLIEELFRHKDKLAEILAELDMTVPEDISKPEQIEIPFKIKEVIIPDKCPACGETEDVIGNKVLYEHDGKICCKSCYGKFELELR